MPLMITGGIKTRKDALDSLAQGAADMVGLGRAMALNPKLTDDWLSEAGGDPEFPRFEVSPPGGITAWYTMLLTALGNDDESQFTLDIPSAIRVYEKRDENRCVDWKKKFSNV